MTDKAFNPQDLPDEAIQSIHEFYQKRDGIMNFLIKNHPAEFEDKEEFRKRVDLEQKENGQETLIIDGEKIVTFSQPRVIKEGDTAKIRSELEYHIDLDEYFEE